MNPVDVSVALAQRLATLGLPTQSENSKLTPTAGQTYLIEDGVLGDSSAHRPVAGGARNNRQGIYQVTVMSPKDGTRAPARLAAADIEAAFFAGLRLERNGTTVAITETRLGPPAAIGERYALPISIYYVAT